MNCRWLSTPDTTLPDGVTRRFTRTLDLGALGLEPGDELYFFVQAYDNRQPHRQPHAFGDAFHHPARAAGKSYVTAGKGLTGDQPSSRNIFAANARSSSTPKN